MPEPRCNACGERDARVVTVAEPRPSGMTFHTHEWLCASCEYLRAHPEAPKAKPLPRERRPKSLQSETLFPVK